MSRDRHHMLKLGFDTGRRHLLAAASILTICASGLSAQSLSATSANSRVAIVIGNQDYTSVGDLTNARKDAEDIADMLRDFDFQVFDGYDLTKREFEELIRTAVLNIPDSADVLFYYAGHGIQIGRRNYLLPVDAKFESVYDVPLATMTLDRVIDTLSARSAAHVAILDSCRDNPFQDLRLAADLDANLFETREGFDVFKTPLNSLIAYSTSPGAVATKNTGWDSAKAFANPATAVQEAGENTLVGRLGTPEDVAKAALFLASADSSWITGAALTIDGGIMTGN